MKYKMIVLDLDGTLTNSRKEITPRTKQALMQAQAKGIHVVLASGRPTYGIMPLAEELELKKYGGFILSFNGGKIINCTDGAVLFEQKLDEKLVPLLYDEAMKAGMAILTYQGEGIAATDKENRYVQEEAFINKMPVVQYNDFLGQLVYPVNKCLIVGDPSPLHELELRLARRWKERWKYTARPTTSLSACQEVSTKHAQSTVSSPRSVSGARRSLPAVTATTTSA